MRKSVLLCLGIMFVLAVSFVSPAIGSSGPKQEAWYTFQVQPFIDIIHLNTNPGGWLNGWDETPSYTAPVLGAVSGGKFYIAIDFTGQYYELAFIVGTAATKDGYLIRTIDGISYDGPDYIWLTPVAEQSRQGPTLAEAAGAKVTPEAWYNLKLNPYIDILHLNTNPGGWLNGWSEAPAPCYPAPILGAYAAGKFYFAMDWKPDGCYEMGFVIGTVKTKDGDMYRTIDGITVDGPTYVWLTPV